MDQENNSEGQRRRIPPLQPPKSNAGDAGVRKFSSGYGTGDKESPALSLNSSASSYSAGSYAGDVGQIGAHEDSEGNALVPMGRGSGFMKTQLDRERKMLQSKQISSDPLPLFESMMGNLSLDMASKAKEPILKHGGQGQPISLTANYIRLKVDETKGVYEYEVRFKPDVDALYVRFELLKQMKEVIGTSKTFDGVSLYLPFHLGQKESIYKLSHPYDESEVKIKIIFKRQKAMSECIHLYNVLLKRIMTELQLARLGRHHYNPAGAKIIPQHKLEVWPGYVTTVDEYEGGLLLCCDTSSKVLRTQTVLELMYEVSMAKKERFQMEIKNILLGSCVLTRYNNRLYRVDDVDFSLNPTCSFDRGTSGKITFQEYYKNHYNLEIRDMSQPMLLSKIKKRQSGMENVEQIVVLVPELCFLTGLTDEMRSDFRVMKDIAVYTRVTPNQKHYALRQFISAATSNANATSMLENWGLKLDDQSLELQGRVVDKERIILASGEIDSGQNADWGVQLARGRAFEAVDLQNWLVIHSPRDEKCATELILNMLKVGPFMGCRIANPDMVALQDDRTETYISALREIIEEPLQLVVIIFPTIRDDRYSAVKKICCSELPIASQVVVSRTLSRPDKVRSIVQKIALQINCKIGGSLWTIKNPYKGCMVVGIDVHHEKGQPSVTGFVSSVNPTLTRWFSKVSIQKPNEQMSNSLQINFYKALEKYFALNNTFPDRIFVYRDGLGEGMIEHINDHEVKQILSTFSKVSTDYSPKFTFVNVHKKINTRFSSIQGNNLANPPPGTVVDHTVNKKYLYDFFLISHNVRQGTVGPTHYIVIHDNSSISPDHIQRFSYKLCHIYFNWPGTIRVPAPCQYANKLATLVGQYIKREPDPSLEDRLFYL